MSSGIYPIIFSLQNTSSTNAKLDILRQHAGNDLLKKVFEYALHPRKNFYIKKIPAPNVNDNSITEMSLEDVFVYLDKFSVRELSGHAARDTVSDILAALTYDDRVVFERLLKRDMKCGTSVASVNKIWEDLIPTYSYMRCSLPKGSNVKKWDWTKGIFIQTKMDGMFANGLVSDSSVTDLLSRAGSPFPTEFAENIRKDLVKLYDLYNDEASRSLTHGDLVTNGELVVLNKKTGKYLPRKEGNGMLNSCLQDGEFDHSKYEVKFVVWDIIPRQNWETGEVFKEKYKYRFDNLVAAISTLELTSIIPVESKIVYSKKEALDVYIELTSKGEEGAVMKSPFMFWEDGTSKDQVKMKMVAEFELEIVGFNPGNGKNADLFGSIKCKSRDGELIVNLPGFKDDVRKDMHNRRDTLIGKIVTGKGNALVNAEGKDTWAIFIPGFVEERLDKTEANSLAEIQEIFANAINSVFGE
jgi:DNA ligase-1